MVADSLLWDGVVVEAGARLDWAIVASRARIGAGAVDRPTDRSSVTTRTIAPNAAVGEDARIPAPGLKSPFASPAVVGTHNR